MTAPSARAAFELVRAATPSLPQTDHAIRRPENNDEEADADQKTEAVAVKTDLDQEVECEGAQDDEDKRADEGADRPCDAADDGDDQDVDATFDRDRARRDLTVVPDLEHAGERRDKGGKS